MEYPQQDIMLSGARIRVTGARIRLSGVLVVTGAG
jgi:hypothetical protein